ncbi:MAG: GspE/PulE family protein [Minisyncoccales bacterium]
MEKEKLKGEIVVKEEERVANLEDLKKSIQDLLSQDTSLILKKILAGAIFLNSSDLHFEPKEKEVLLRIRLDGLLYPVFVFPSKTYKEILLRLKMLSGMKINITDRPQDGRFTILADSREVEIRSSCLLSEWGESFVARILDPLNLRSLNDLGLRDDLLSLFQREIKRPHGMIIVTGPTGSGKTTTLYAFLSEIKRPEIKIITIENPIEYRLTGIVQTQVEPGKDYDFSNGLRAIMRQDPDVVLVGEIRDLETAELALQASLTGHLVLSTLHTNDATGVVSRFLSLGAKPFHIAPALKLVVAQRLVRRICQKCKVLKEIDSLSLDIMKKILDNIKGINVSPKTKIAFPKGCKECNFTGYKGRIGVFEAFQVDSEMEGLILKAPSSSLLRKKAREKGMITLLQDGLLKVLKQITTMEEVEKTIGFFED